MPSASTSGPATCRIEMAGECARTEEGRLVALAFLLGEADDLDAEGQAPALAVQLAHAGHGHEDAEAAVVLAAVANGVVVRAGEQASSRCGWRAFVHADHVADGVDRHLVEAGSPSSSASICRAAGEVGFGEVGDGELAELGVGGIGVHAPAVRHSPTRGCRAPVRRRTCRRGGSRRCGGCCAGIRRTRSRRRCAAGARRSSMISAFGEPVAARSAHGEDERKAELLRCSRR
jgi:hypothetical protein